MAGAHLSDVFDSAGGQMAGELLEADAHLSDVFDGAGGPDRGARVALADGHGSAAAAGGVRLLAQLPPQPRSVIARGVVPKDLQEDRAQLRHPQPHQIPAL